MRIFLTKDYYNARTTETLGNLSSNFYWFNKGILILIAKK